MAATSNLYADARCDEAPVHKSLSISDEHALNECILLTSKPHGLKLARVAQENGRTK